MQNRLANTTYTDDDSLANHRDRIVYLLGKSAIIFVLPVGFYNIIDGETLLGILTIVTFALLAVEAVTIRFNFKLSWVMPLFVSGLMIVIWLVILKRGVIGTYWAYPTVLFISFVVSHKTAKIYLLVFFVYMSALTFYFIELAVATRAIFGLIITITFTNIFLNVIYEQREKLLRKSITDPLTGALNRRELSFTLESAIERKSRSGETAALLSIDIDNFKSINDVYGHAAGDYVITELVNFIKRRARKLDQLFRVGGDEFVLFLPMTNGSDANTVANEFCELVAGSKIIEGRQVTISVGTSELGRNTTADEWLKRADKAVYASKESGRNRAVRWRHVAEKQNRSRKTSMIIPKPKTVLASGSN